MFEDVVKVAMDVPLFAGRSVAEISVERLGGQTNSNFLISVDGAKYVLRIAGAGTDMIINRKSDAANSRVAAKIGVSTRVLFVDENTGVMLREFVEGIPLANEDFRNLEKIEHAARALKIVHECGHTFETRFDILTKLDEYETMVRKAGGPVPVDYFELAEQSDGARKLIQNCLVDLRPCHNDLVAANFLDISDRFLVLDWEYSGMNDPMFDLAAFAAEAYFTPEQQQHLLESYFSGDVPPLDESRMTVYRVLWNQWVTLWSMVQIANWNVGDNFWDWGMVHLAEYTKGVKEDSFARSLQAIQQGLESGYMTSRCPPNRDEADPAMPADSGQLQGGDSP